MPDRAFAGFLLGVVVALDVACGHPPVICHEVAPVETTYVVVRGNLREYRGATFEVFHEGPERFVRVTLADEVDVGAAPRQQDYLLGYSFYSFD